MKAKVLSVTLGILVCAVWAWPDDHPDHPDKSDPPETAHVVVGEKGSVAMPGKDTPQRETREGDITVIEADDPSFDGAVSVEVDHDTSDHDTKDADHGEGGGSNDKPDHDQSDHDKPDHDKPDHEHPDHDGLR